jgi:hypothetical protein
MTFDELQRVREGWAVVGNDGGNIGSVQEVHENHVVVEHGLINKKALYVPISVISSVGDDSVELSIPAGEAGGMGWHVPPGSVPGAGPGTLQTGGDMTTMTGGGYGAGGTAAAAGPLSPTRGDQIHDRFGGSSRAGLGRPKPQGGDDDAPVADEATGAPRTEQQRRDARED